MCLVGTTDRRAKNEGWIETCGMLSINRFVLNWLPNVLLLAGSVTSKNRTLRIDHILVEVWRTNITKLVCKYGSLNCMPHILSLVNFHQVTNNVTLE